VKLFARLAGVAAVLVAFLIYTEAEYYIVLGSIIVSVR